MRDQGKYTQLYPTIKKYLIDRNYASCHEIQSQIFSDSLYLNILGKDLPSFATDLNHSIQVEFANKNVEQQLGRFVRNPTNQLVTDYYFIKEKQWHAFNCSKRILERDNPHGQLMDTQTNPLPIHAYQPQFYFTKDYSDFCVQKLKGNSYFLNCKRIRIFKWRFRIVNVSKSGWYVPVLEAIDFKYEYESVKEDFKGVSCIIYEDSLRLMMERLRLQDLRGRNMQKLPHEQQGISMLYFLRNAKNATGRRANIFKADKQKILLSYLKLPTLKYVLFGDAKGPLPLQEGIVQAPMYEDRIKLINMENLQVLFNRKEPPKPQEKERALWSSSDEDQDKEEAEKKLPAVVAMVDQSEESNDQEDPLRNLYLKEFNEMRIEK